MVINAGGDRMFKGGEYLKNIKGAVQKNVECCKYALQNSCKVRILGKGQSTEGYVTRVTWDDMEDVININTGETNQIFSGSEIATVRLIE